MFPQRVNVSIMGLFAIAVAYTMRVSLSVAIVEMVEPVTNTGIENNNTGICLETTTVTFALKNPSINVNKKKYSTEF